MRLDTYGPRMEEKLHKPLTPDDWDVALRWIAQAAIILRRGYGVETGSAYNVPKQETANAK